MKVIRAKSAGFCFGVERAIGIARKCTNCGLSKVYTDGPLIHNRQMMEKLKTEGILEIGDYQSSQDLNNQLASSHKDSDVLVVRAHGVSPERREYLKNLGLTFKDATCPDVGRSIVEMQLSIVVLPDPEGPMMAMYSPGATSKETPSSARVTFARVP